MFTQLQYDLFVKLYILGTMVQCLLGYTHGIMAVA